MQAVTISLTDLTAFVGAANVSLNTFLLQVKEVIISYYILMEQGKATVQVSLSPSSPYCIQATLCNRGFTGSWPSNYTVSVCLCSGCWSDKFHHLSRLNGKLVSKSMTLLYLSSFQDLDSRCEQLIKEEFGMECNFDVVDAVKKLEKLGIVSRVSYISIHKTIKP